MTSRIWRQGSGVLRSLFETPFERTHARSFAAQWRRSSVKPRQGLRKFSQTSSRENPLLYRFLRGSGSQLLSRWAASPNFYYQVGGITVVVGVVYVANLEEVPVSGRKRLRIMPEAVMTQVAEQAFQQTLAEVKSRLLPEWDPRYKMVRRVAQRLIPHTGLPADQNEWQVYVIDDPQQQNAFVLPGRQIFVFSGILNTCRDDDGLATVLGHEMAHNVANHMGEKMTLGAVFMVLGLALSVFLGTDIGITRIVSNLAFSLPNGRTQESEADYIGLLMMSEACFNPKAAADFWERMAEAGKGQSPPELLSTHPNEANRRLAIQGWLDKAELKREESGCSPLMKYQEDFSRAFTRWT